MLGKTVKIGPGKMFNHCNSSYSHSLKICELTVALLILMLVGGVEHRALHMLGKCSATGLHPQPQVIMFESWVF